MKRQFHWHHCCAEPHDEVDFAMTWEELTVMAIDEELEKAKQTLPPEQRGSVPLIPPDFLDEMARS